MNSIKIFCLNKSTINLLKTTKLGNTHIVFRLLLFIYTNLLDVVDGFQVAMKPLEPVETEDIELICTANKYEYPNIKWSYRRNPTDDAFKLVTENVDIKLIEQSDLLSHRVILRIKRASSRNDGQYECRAYDGGIAKSNVLTLRLKGKQDAIRKNWN